MKVKNTDLTIPDILYVCPVCLDIEPHLKKTPSYWNMGNLVLHIKRKHPEHYTGNKKND